MIQAVYPLCIAAASNGSVATESTSGMLGRVVRRPSYAADALRRFCAALSPEHPINAFALLVLVDDAEHGARSLDNFLWVTFTRMNPALDMDGIYQPSDADVETAP